MADQRTAKARNKKLGEIASAEQPKVDKPEFDYSADPEFEAPIEYPDKADARGTARVRFRNKEYYLGPWKSNYSFIMFAMFREHIERFGEVPEPGHLRPIAQAALKNEPFAPPSLLQRHWFVAAVVVCCISISIANYCGYRYFSSFKAVMVEGRPLDESDLTAIRGHRLYLENKAKTELRPDERAKLVADIRARLDLEAEAMLARKRELGKDSKDEVDEATDEREP